MTGLAARRLHKLYRDARASGSLGGSTTLWRLVRESWRAFAAAEGEARVLAFVLASMFEQLARSNEDRALAAEEASTTWNLFDQPIASALEILSGGHSPAETMAALSRLAEAFSRVQRGDQ